MDDDAREMLVAMGFDAVAAQNALEETAGNLEQAANYLLLRGGGAGAASNDNGSSATASASTTGMRETDAAATAATADGDTVVVMGTLSQYSVPNGRSACTYMALAGATQFLQQQQQQATIPSVNSAAAGAAASSSTTTTRASVVVDAAFLDNIVRQGSQIYNNAQQRRQQTNPSASADSVEHASAEEALSTGDVFPHLRLQPGGIRQGILSHDFNHPMGLSALLAACQQQSSSWTCVVVTKTPETVLICLPPVSPSCRCGWR